MDQIEQWKGLLATSLDEFLSTLGSYLPSVIGALVLMITGILVAWLCRWLILRLGQGMDRMTQKFAFASSAVHFRWSITKMLANVSYWLILLFFVTATAESLGLPGIAEWLGQIINYLPSVLIALLIVWFGFILGSIVRDQIIAIATANELAHAEELGTASRITVIALTIVIGLSQIGIHIQLIEHLLVVVVAAVVISLALAFGLGAGPAMSNIIAIGNLKQRYAIGEHIKVDQIEGTILSFTKTAVIIDTGEEQAMVPGRIFQEHASFLVMTDDEVNNA